MYIRHSTVKSLEILLDLCKYQSKAEVKALLDCGATENFIDPDTVAQVGLGTIKLETPRPVRNVDGTLNKAGVVDRACDLIITQGNKKTKQRFYVTKLGSDRLILGYPWFREFNPNINWKHGNIIRSKIKLETVFKNWAHKVMDKINLWKQKANDEITDKLYRTYCDPAPGVTPSESKGGCLEDQIHRTHIASDMAHKHQETHSQMEITLPEQFKEFEQVFSEEEAQKMPPRRDCDHKIELTDDAPRTFNFKPYLKGPKELESELKFIQENEKKGYIRKSDPPSGFPTLEGPKKASQKRSFISTPDPLTRSPAETSTPSQIYN